MSKTFTINYVKGNLIDKLAFGKTLIMPGNIETGIAGNLAEAVKATLGLSADDNWDFTSTTCEIGDLIHSMHGVIVLVSKERPTDHSTRDAIEQCFEHFFLAFSSGTTLRRFIMPKVFCGGEHYSWREIHSIIINAFTKWANESDDDDDFDISIEVVITPEEWDEDAQHEEVITIDEDESDDCDDCEVVEQKLEEPSPTVTITLPVDEAVTFAASLLGKVNHGIEPETALDEVIERYHFEAKYSN